MRYISARLNVTVENTDDTTKSERVVGRWSRDLALPTGVFHPQVYEDIVAWHTVMAASDLAREAGSTAGGPFYNLAANTLLEALQAVLGTPEVRRLKTEHDENQGIHPYRAEPCWFCRWGPVLEDLLERTDPIFKPVSEAAGVTGPSQNQNASDDR